METATIKIDKEFAALCRALTPEEESLLESQLCDEGCRDPLVLWAGHDILLDGHNRRRLCDRNGLEYQTTEVVLANREQAIEWIITNQLGKRNLSEDEKSYLRGKRYKHEKKKQGAAEGNASAAKNKVATVTTLKTSEKLADEYGVSPKTIRNDAKFADAVDAIAEVAPEVKGEILSGKSTATRKEIKEVAALPKAERKEAAQKLAEPKAKESPTAINEEMAADVLRDDLCAVITKHKKRWLFTKEPFVGACSDAVKFAKEAWKT